MNRNAEQNNTIQLAEQHGFFMQNGLYAKRIRGEILTFEKIHDVDELEATTLLQQAVFCLSERDVCPGHMLATLNKLLGLVIGVYNPDRSLVGFSYSWPMFTSNGHKTLLLDMIGIEESSRDLGIGYETMIITMIEAMNMGIDEIRFTFDPLKSRNANIYLKKIGAEVIQFEQDPYGDAGLSGDRFLASWNLQTNFLKEDQTPENVTKYTLDDFDSSQIITPENYPQSIELLLPAPEDDEKLSEEIRMQWASFYREVGNRYFPQYQAVYFISESHQESRENYYVLRRQERTS